MRTLRICLLFGCALLLSACSTIINKTTQEIPFKSTPANAKLTIDGKKYGTTPQVVNLERGSNHVVRFELAGYEPYEIQLTTRLSGWVWANVANGFIPGFAIDYLNGSMYDLFPEGIDVPLTPLPVVEPPAPKKK